MTAYAKAVPALKFVLQLLLIAIVVPMGIAFIAACLAWVFWPLVGIVVALKYLFT